MLFQFQKTNSLIFTGWMMANQVSIIFFCRTFLDLAKLKKHNIMSLFSKFLIQTSMKLEIACIQLFVYVFVYEIKKRVLLLIVFESFS